MFCLLIRAHHPRCSNENSAPPRTLLVVFPSYQVCCRDDSSLALKYLLILAAPLQEGRKWCCVSDLSYILTRLMLICQCWLHYTAPAPAAGWKEYNTGCLN